MNKTVETKKQNNNEITKEIGTCAHNVRNYFRQYCRSTSIHGFRYFGENRSIFERVWWAVTFFICMSGCLYMIYKIYERYENCPVIVTFATKETSVHQIPFPAVTICPETKSNRSKFDFTEVMHKRVKGLNISETEDKYLRMMAILCDDVDHKLTAKWKNYTNSNSFFDTLHEIQPESFFITCKFLGISFECEDFFIPMITDEGICYSFNILDRHQIFNDFVVHYKNYHEMSNKKTASWDLENGYHKELGVDAYPRRAFLSGAENGLTLYLTAFDKDLDYRCKGIQGFKVVLHSPIRIPRLKQEYFRIPLDHAVVAAVQPVMITTSQAVKSYDVDKRGCYFSSEKKLKYFRSYSQENCQLECLTNVTLSNCSCVNVFMPRDNHTDICGPAKYKCMQNAEKKVVLDELFNKLYDKDVYCDCLPVCSDLSYNTLISQINWEWEETFKAMDEDDPWTEIEEVMHMSSLTVYFKFNHFITSERQTIYGPTDFLANFGGVLGLFTGFSILSLMEIIYFLTVRICCNVKLYGRWTGT